jgi:hypothetical protein
MTFSPLALLLLAALGTLLIAAAFDFMGGDHE